VIESFFSNELNLRRYRRFKANKSAVVSTFILLFLIFLSVTANFWANNQPIIMQHKGELYIPAVKTYHPSVFGIEGEFITDYKNLELVNDSDWKLWPPIRWGTNESNPNLDSYPSKPTSQNWFGTDDRGRDVLTRLLYGFRYSFGFAIIVWLLSFAIGICMGALMGFSGGLVDLIGQRLVEVVESLPFLILLITLVSIFGASMTLLVIFLSLFGWITISYYVRAEFLKLRRLDFVEAARAVGGSRLRQVFKHILPNALGPVITFSPFVIAANISTLAILDFLGFGLPPPTPSWGELFQQAQKNVTVAWWLAVYPALALFISIMVMNLIGDGIRDAFDPRK